MFHSIRWLILLLEAISILSPLLKKKRTVLKMSVLLKQLTLLALTNSEFIWKFLENKRFSFESIKNFLKVFRKAK